MFGRATGNVRASHRARPRARTVSAPAFSDLPVGWPREIEKLGTR
jgi:hypothetical protein